MHWLIIDGVIGAGKSYLLQLLSEAPRLRERYSQILLVPEPVELWESSGMLAKFYSNPKQYALEFQLYAVETRVTKLWSVFNNFSKIGAAKPSDLPILIIAERSPWSDREVFAAQQIEAGNITADQARKYDSRWLKIVCDLPCTPTHYLHFAPDLQVCMDRMYRRGRSAEDNVDLVYQEKLHARYLDFFTKLGKPQMQITDGADFRTDPVAYDLLIQNVLALLAI